MGYSKVISNLFEYKIRVFVITIKENSNLKIDLFTIVKIILRLCCFFTLFTVCIIVLASSSSSSRTIFIFASFEVKEHY